MLNNIIKNNSVLENKKSNILLYIIATLITLTFSSGSNEVYASNCIDSNEDSNEDSNDIDSMFDCIKTYINDSYSELDPYFVESEFLNRPVNNQIQQSPIGNVIQTNNSISTIPNNDKFKYDNQNSFYGNDVDNTNILGFDINALNLDAILK